MNNIEKAKEILISGEYTCVLHNGDETYSSNLKGVKPLLDFLNSEKDFSGFSAADKVVGAGAAHLYVLLQVENVWAGIISQSAKEILEENRIQFSFEKQVPFIINRTGDGVCPIEQAVKGIRDSQDALTVIEKTLNRLNQKST